MGVVRREGPWRLEKEADGHYEITHQKDTQAKVITAEYDPGMMDDPSLAPIPVHEVNSYEEAKGTFEEYVNGNRQTGMDPLIGGNSTTDLTGEGDLDIGLGGEGSDDLGFGDVDDDLLEDVEDLPPGGFALALLLVGGFVVSTSGFALSEPVFVVGAGMVGVGLIILVWAGVLYNRQGWNEAVEFLATTDTEKQSTGKDNDTERDQAKTPPTPEKIKRELIFGRADQECEWCGDFVDNPEVHHIKPRSEGGPNTPKNLIVLCPTCHRKADSGGISRTKLREKIRHITIE